MTVQLPMLGLLVRDMAASLAFRRARCAELTGYGCDGRRAPVRPVGPHAAMVDDPDGNAILLAAG